MPKVTRITVILIVLAITSAAFATPQKDKRQTDYGPCTYETIDACFHEGDWWYERTHVENGQPFPEVLSCGLTEGCKACGQTSQGKPVCVQIEYTAACRCATTPVPGAGPNIVQCNSQGSCDFRH